jgi:hypothetical protein
VAELAPNLRAQLASIFLSFSYNDLQRKESEGSEDLDVLKSAIQLA